MRMFVKKEEFVELYRTLHLNTANLQAYCLVVIYLDPLVSSLSRKV